MTGPQRPLADADLHAFVDGQLDIERRVLVVQAMDGDPELRAKIDQWRRQNEALTATFGSVLKEPVPLRLMPTSLARTSIGAVEPHPAPPAKTAAQPRTSASVVMVAIGAFLVGGASMFTLDALTTGPGASASAVSGDLMFPAGGRGLALRAFEAHRTFASDLDHPVEVSAGDAPHLSKWIQHRLAAPVHIPDLHQEGWTLMGGRVLPGEFGPAAFLMYRNGIERLGLYVARTTFRQRDPLSVYDNGAGLGSVAYWADDALGYAITTDRDGSWLERSGADLQRIVETQTHIPPP